MSLALFFRLAKSAVKREDINQESKYDKAQRLKKEAMIEGSKRRKRKAEEEMENKAKKAKVGDSAKKKMKKKIKKKNSKPSD